MGAGSDAGPPIWFGAIFVLVGAFIMGIGGGIVPVDPSSVHAPGWVVVLCGAVFALAGVATWAGRFGDEWSEGFALLIVGCFALIASWVAFGPGERQFTGGVSVGPAGGGGPVGDRSGRIAFGVGAVSLWAFTALLIGRLVKRVGGLLRNRGSVS